MVYDDDTGPPPHHVISSDRMYTDPEKTLAPPDAIREHIVGLARKHRAWGPARILAELQQARDDSGDISPDMVNKVMVELRNADRRRSDRSR